MNYILYDDDEDGFSAAFAAWLKYGDAAQYIPVARGDEPPSLQNADKVYVLDFNYPRNTTLEMKQEYPQLEVIDHHASAQEELGDLPYCHFDMSVSAAILAWKFFHPAENVPAFIGYVSDADLWQWALPLSKEVHLAIKAYDMDFKEWQKISGITIPRDLHKEGKCLEDLMEEGDVIRKFAKREVKKMADHARTANFLLNGSARISFDPGDDSHADECYQVPTVNASALKSEVCDKLLKENPDAKFVACYHDNGKGLRVWGLRSRKDFDVSKVAKKFSGGGHPMAAGFRTYHCADYGVPVKPQPDQAK